MANAAGATSSLSSSGKDRHVVLWLGAVVLAAIVVFAIFGPRQDDDDLDPTTFNSGSRGTKVAYLLLPELGYAAERSETPLTQLHNADASHTTLVLTEPRLPIKALKQEQDEIAEFLRRGGRVLATGYNGAKLLPGGNTADPTLKYTGLCFTRPEGAGAIARAGQVSIEEPVRWASDEPAFRVEERCGQDAVVVRYKVGQGEAVWWSSPMPLTNAGLSDDASLKLLLASVGPATGPASRKVLFDEYLHSSRESISDTLKGLPWWAMALQFLAVGLLLVLSRGRRNGPIRMPVHLSRTSPVEFAESMGRLYDRAGVTSAATEAARGRLLDYLREQCGMPREMLQGEAAGVARGLTERFGGEWSALEQHLAQASDAASTQLSGKSALKLVQSLDEDLRRLEQVTQMQRHAVLTAG